MEKICDFPSHKFYDDELETPKETKNVYWEQLKVLWPKKGIIIHLLYIALFGMP